MRLSRFWGFARLGALSVSVALGASCLSGCTPMDAETGGANTGGANTGGEDGQNLPPQNGSVQDDLPGGSVLGDPFDTPDGGEPNGSDVDSDPSRACHSLKDCVDGDVCTTDACVGGVCRWSENNIVACSDTDPCTQNDICVGGACVGTPVVCPGGSVCDRGVCVDGGNTPVSPSAPVPEVLMLDLGDGIAMELTYIEAGEFMMGTDSRDFVWLDHSRPVHRVTITRGFYIGTYEVTQSQWGAVMGVNPSSFVGNNRPVETVSWNDARAFVEALSAMTGYDIRLPGEAEWEYACRAGTATEYFFGDDVADLDLYGWHEGNTDFRTQDVGGKLPNAWGLFDMHGNVWEWCEDTWHDDYAGAPLVGDPWTTGGESTKRVLRGGSWEESGVSLHRSAARRSVGPDGLRGSYGFRIVAEE